MEKEKETEKQLFIWREVSKCGTYCPQCKSNGGQHMTIENPGEDWTQVHCAYGCGYYNLDNYYKTK